MKTILLIVIVSILSCKTQYEPIDKSEYKPENAVKILAVKETHKGIRHIILRYNHDIDTIYLNQSLKQDSCYLFIPKNKKK
jgi:hypothetical protein